MLAIMSQIIPRRVLLRQQRMFILSMVGLMTGPFLSAILGGVADSWFVFVFVGVLLIVCALVCYASLRSLSLNHHASATYMKTPSLCSAFNDMNVSYSTLLHTHALVCITFLLTTLSFHLCRVDATQFNIDTRLGLIHIATYYLAFVASFIILSFPASALVSQHCGSLRTMLLGMGGMALGLMLIFASTSSVAIDTDKSLKFIVAGLIVMGVSSAFTVTPYSLYVRSALYKKYRKQTVSVAFDVYRCSVCVALCAGPMLGCVAYSLQLDDEMLFFFLSIASFMLSFVGWTLFKCLRWQRKAQPANDRQRLSSSLLDGPPLKSAIPTPIDQQIASFANIRYMPILQDDKRCWCCCAHLLCFCSLGAIWDRLHHNLDAMDRLHPHSSHRRKANVKLNQSKTSYHSLDNLLPSSEKKDVTGQLVTVANHSAARKWHRPSVGGAPHIRGGHDYARVLGADVRTASKDYGTAPPTTPDEWRASQALSQSWKTIAGLSMGTASSSTPSPLQHHALHRKVYQCENEQQPMIVSREQSHESKTTPVSARSAPKMSLADRSSEYEPEPEIDVDVEMSVSRKHVDGGQSPPDIAAIDASNKNDDALLMENTSGAGYTLNSCIPVYSVLDIMDQKQPSTLRSTVTRTLPLQYTQNTSIPSNGQTQSRTLTFDPSEESEKKGSQASTASPAPQMTPVFTGTGPFAHPPRHTANQRQNIRRAPPTNNGVFVREQSAVSVASSMNELSATDAQSQTFMLLSDDDFLSRRDSDDIYNAVPEIQDESFSIPPEQ